MPSPRCLFAPSPLVSGALALALPITTVLVLGVAACEDSAAPGSSGSSGQSLDGSTSSFEGGAKPEASTTNDSGQLAECTEANYVNGVIADPPNGTISHDADNIIDARVVVAGGTVPCEAKFDPNGGVQLGASMSGAWDIQCNGTKDAEYYGFHIHGLGKMGDSGTKYTIGKAAVVGNALNDQVDLTYESGSRCGNKAATLREWEGGPSLPGRGTFLVQDHAGSNVKFFISLTDMKPSARNVAGKGTFSLTLTVVDAAPLTIVGLP
jgi:hypothetical protein